MDNQTRRKVVAALRLAAVKVAGNDSFGDLGAGRVYLMDGEEVSFEEMQQANEDEGFLKELLALKNGVTLKTGGGAAAEFEIKRIK